VATVAGFAGAAAVFAVMFWLVDARAVLDAVRRADPGLILVAAGTILLWNVSWGCALYNVLGALDIDVPVHTALLVNAAGAFANHVTPFGQAGGEPVTAWLLSRTTETEYEVSLASITSLDAINVVPSLLFATGGSLYYVAATGTGSELGVLPLAVVGGAAVVAVAVAVGWRYRDGARARVNRTLVPLVERASGLLPGRAPIDPDALAGRVAEFTGALGRVAVSRNRLAAAIGCSALGWAFQAVGLWVVFLALDAPIPVYVPFFVLPLGKVGSALPTPGGLGGTEAVNVTLLALLTGAGAAPIAAAVTIHSVGGYLLTTSIGAAATSALGVR